MTDAGPRHRTSVTATALVAPVGNTRTFKNGRQFAAWLGMVPRQHSSGDTRRLGRITKRGDVYLRTLLIHGARAVMRQLVHRTDVTSRWVLALKARRGFNSVGPPQRVPKRAKRVEPGAA